MQENKNEKFENDAETSNTNSQPIYGGKFELILGSILIAIQLLVFVTNGLPRIDLTNSTVLLYDLFSTLGYSLFGIIGLVFFCIGFKKFVVPTYDDENHSAEEDEKSDINEYVGEDNADD